MYSGYSRVCVTLLLFLIHVVVTYATSEPGCGLNISFIDNIPDEGPDLAPDLAPDISSLGEANVLVFQLYMFDKQIDTTIPYNTLDVLDESREFFRANSNGKQQYTFTIYGNGRLQIPEYSSIHCMRDSTTCPGTQKFFDSITSQPLYSGYNRYMIIYYNRCDCLRWAGVGEVGGSWSWYNGPVSLQIVAHELGHNNRALHSNFLNWEYGNPFSVMGIGSKDHFTTAGKLAMKWLDENLHVRTLARPEEGKCFQFDNCIQTCTPQIPCVYDIYAHDTGSYLDSRIYTLRILTEQFYNEHIYIEYRQNYDTKYAASINGVLVFWGLTPAKSGRGSFVTSIEDYNSTTRSQTDAYVPIGKSFVHDYENVGAVITPLTKIEGGIRVSVYFTKHVASEIENILPGYDLGCGTTNKIITLSEKRGYNLYETYIQEETVVKLTINNLNCSSIVDSRAGLYVYPTYPLHLEINENPDLGNRAIFYKSFTCSDEIETFEFRVASSWTRNVDKDIYTITPFSNRNYLLFYIGNNYSEIEFNVSLNESVSCYSPCSVIFVDSPNDSLKGKFSLSQELKTNTSTSIFRKGSYTIEFDQLMGKWVIRDDSNIFAVQEPSTSIPVYPHVLKWTNEISMTCIQRLQDSDIDQILIILIVSSVIGFFILLCILYKVFRKIRKKTKKKNSRINFQI